MKRAGRVMLGLLGLMLFSVIHALVTGSAGFGWLESLAAVFGLGDPLVVSVVSELRLPRVFGALLAGGLLALAGALMQVLLRNPLADPYVLGVSGGASLAALLVMLAGLGGFWLGLGSFAGALCAMLLVFGLAHARGRWSLSRLLLTGVIVAAGWGALISFVLAIAPDARLRGMLYWLMGDLAGVEPGVFPLLVLGIGLALAWMLARDLNLLARGGLQAAVLGVPVNALRMGIYFLASLLTAAAVSLAGNIGFIGLIIPHLLRLLIGSDHRLLLPAAVVLGGSFLLLADTLARSLFAPQQLPVGVLTALLGVPVFLYLLQREGR